MNRRTKDQILVYGGLTIAGLFVLAVASIVLVFDPVAFVPLVGVWITYFWLANRL